MEFLCDLASKIRKNIKKLFSLIKHLAKVIKCWICKKKKSNDMLPNYHFFVFYEKSFSRPSIGLISHFSIFSGSRFLNFFKKGAIPCNVNIKLLVSAKVTMYLPYFNTILQTFFWVPILTPFFRLSYGCKFSPTQKAPFEQFFSWISPQWLNPPTLH